MLSVIMISVFLGVLLSQNHSNEHPITRLLCQSWWFHPIESSWWIMFIYVFFALDLTLCAWGVQNFGLTSLSLPVPLIAKLLTLSYYLFSFAGGFTGGVVHSAYQLLEYKPQVQILMSPSANMDAKIDSIKPEDLKRLKEDRDKASWYSLLPFLSALLSLAIVCLTRNNAFNFTIETKNFHWTPSLIWSFSFLVGFFSKAVLNWLSKLFGDTEKKKPENGNGGPMPLPQQQPMFESRPVAIKPAPAPSTEPAPAATALAPVTAG